MAKKQTLAEAIHYSADLPGSKYMAVGSIRQDLEAALRPIADAFKPSAEIDSLRRLFEGREFARRFYHAIWPTNNKEAIHDLLVENLEPIAIILAADGHPRYAAKLRALCS